MSAEWDEMALVGRIARTHGNRGHVIVNPETDFPERRFQIGHVLYRRRGDRVEAVTINAVRFHQGRPIIGISGVATMNDAEEWADAELRVPTEALTQLPASVYYRHDLVGCTVQTVAGATVGTVVEVEGSLSKSRLIIRGTGDEVIVPLAAPICVRIDLAARLIVIDPPDGLLELNAQGSSWRSR
jgi:16S rRNA processing protein RimM